jgi:hypothetical protein
MNKDYRQIARATASRLAPQFGEQLVVQTEQALTAPPPRERPEKYDAGLTVAVASLIVSAAQLVVGIIALRRSEVGRQDAVMDPSNKEAIRRQLDKGLETPPSIDPEQRDAIIDASVEEGTSADI